MTGQMPEACEGRGQLMPTCRLVYKAGKVLLKPARPGTGVIAGSVVRAVMDAAGIKDILTKSIGSNNPINVIRATFTALEELRSRDTVMKTRNLQDDVKEEVDIA